MKHKKAGGFTLLEVLVSATIIAVLTAIGVVSYASVNKRSRDVKRRSDLEQIRSALEMYRADNSQYPTIGGTFANVSGLSTALVNSGYMPSVPDDPSTTGDYYYLALSTSGVYATYCLCGNLESITSGSQNSCSISLHSSCDYGLKNP